MDQPAESWPYEASPVCQLLLVKNLHHLGLLAIGMSHCVRDGARLTVSRVDDAASCDNFTAILGCHRQGVIVHRFVRSGVVFGIAGHRVIFAG
jgi:hypothetical protein